MRNIIIFLLLLSAIFAYEIPLDKAKKTMPYGEIDKRATCFITRESMLCYAAMKVNSNFFTTFLPVISTNDIEFQKTTGFAQKSSAMIFVPQEKIRIEEKERCMHLDEQGLCTETQVIRIERRVADVSSMQPISSIMRSGTYVVMTTHEVFEKNAYSITPYFDPDISACGSTIIGSGTYVLTDNLNCSGTALIIDADNVIFDCAGHEINYSREEMDGVGILATNKNNITVRNCGLKQHNPDASNAHGIQFTSVRQSSIGNSSISTAGEFSFGVYFYQSANSSLSNSTISTANYGAYGIHFDSSSNNSLSKLTVSTIGASAYGVYFSSSSNNSLANLSISTNNSVASGIYLYLSPNNTVFNVSISTNDLFAYGLYISSPNNRLSSCSISTNGSFAYGIYLSSSNNSFSNFSISTNGVSAYGIHLSSSNSSFSNFFISTNGSSAYGIYLSSSSNNSFTNFTINTTQTNAPKLYFYGFSLPGSTNNRIANITFLGQSANQTYIRVSGNNTLLNVSNLNRSAITYFSSPTIGWNITLQQYVRLNITDFSGTPIPSASSNYTNAQSQQGAWQLSDANGLTDWLIMNDTIFRGAGGNIDYNNYTITANKTLYLPNTTSINFSYSGTFNIMLKLNITTPPYVILRYPKQFDVVYSRDAPFWCEAYDNVSVANITVCVYYPNETLKECKTQQGSGNFTYNQTIRLANGNYEWNCTAANIGSLNSSNTTTYYFQVYAVKEQTGGGAGGITYIYILFVIIMAAVVGYWIYKEAKDSVRNDEKNK